MSHESVTSLTLFGAMVALLVQAEALIREQQELTASVVTVENLNEWLARYAEIQSWLPEVGEPDHCDPARNHHSMPHRGCPLR